MDSLMRDESLDHDMLLILSLDPNASLMFSVYTGQWYVSARIGITNGATITGITVHGTSPVYACRGYVARLKQIRQASTPDERLVTDAHTADRMHWYWNGAAFVRDPYWKKEE